MKLLERYSEILKTAKGEREVHKFLKEDPLLVWATVMNFAGHADYVVPEFSLGNRYRTDFVVMQSFSGGWNVAFIELEPIDENPFMKDGKPSKRLRGAIDQIKGWRNFEEDEGMSLRSDLAKAAKKNDILYPERNLAREPSCATMQLRDPKTYLRCEYYIIMGRREHFDDDLIHEKSKFHRHYNINLLTYDRFLEVAKKLDQNNSDTIYKSRNISQEDQIFLDRYAGKPDQLSIFDDQVEMQGNGQRC